MPVAVAGRVASISHPANRGQLPKIAELAAAMDRVSECHRLAGEDCFLIKVHAPSV
jgi:DNA-binding Lrp family transcriptional regulator